MNLVAPGTILGRAEGCDTIFDGELRSLASDDDDCQHKHQQEDTGQSEPGATSHLHALEMAAISDSGLDCRHSPVTGQSANGLPCHRLKVRGWGLLCVQVVLDIFPLI